VVILILFAALSVLNALMKALLSSGASDSPACRRLGCGQRAGQVPTTPGWPWLAPQRALTCQAQAFTSGRWLLQAREALSRWIAPPRTSPPTAKAAAPMPNSPPPVSVPPPRPANERLLKEIRLLAVSLGAPADGNATAVELVGFLRKELTQMKGGVDKAVAAMDTVEEAKSAARRAQARAFAAEMRAEMKAATPDVPVVPASKLNRALFELNYTKLEATRMQQEGKAAAAKIAQLERDLQEATGRATELSKALREMGDLVDVGGLGGLWTFMMSEKELINKTKSRILQLKG